MKAQREIKELEKKRNTMRQELFVLQDDVDKKKEALLDEIEARLQQKIEKTGVVCDQMASLLKYILMEKYYGKM